ncbi:MAG: hypothetical protein U9Q34_03950 [Elusimicrobiota bacterium]|nr:hypothetical protein [Elusimicrobiota bacterium]
MDIILPLIIFGIIIIIALFSGKKVKKELSSLKTFLNGKVESKFFSLKFVGDFKGLPFEIRQIAGGKNSPPKIRIRMNTNRPLTLKVYKRSLMISLSVKLGLLGKTLTTGDIEFDKTFRAISNDINTHSFLASLDNRTIIRNLFESGFQTFKIKKGHIEISKHYYEIKDELAQEKITPILEALYKLSLA